VYEAILNNSGAKLRQASASNGCIAVRERFAGDRTAILFIGNYYNEDQQGQVTYTHPESGEAIHIPYVQDGMLWPALYGVLTPVCLAVADGIKLLHSTSDVLGVAEIGGQLAINLHGDRDLAGEIVFEGARVDHIQAATIDGEPVKMIRDNKRVTFLYHHKHREEINLSIKIVS
jgi:hypothetical protein